MSASPKKATTAASPARKTTSTSAASPTKTPKKAASKKKVSTTLDVTKERYSMGITPKHNISFCGYPAKKVASAAADSSVVVPTIAEEVDGVPAPTPISTYTTSSVVLRAIAEGYAPKGMEVYVDTIKYNEKARNEVARPAHETSLVEETPAKKSAVAKKVRAAPKKKKASTKKGSAKGFSTRSGALRVYGQLAHAFIDASSKKDTEGQEEEEPQASADDVTAALTHLGVAHLHCFGGTGETATKKKTKAKKTVSGPQPCPKKSYGYFFAAGSPKINETPTPQTLLSRYYMATQQLRGQGTEKSIHAAQEGFNYVIEHQRVDKSLASAAAYQLGRLHETGKFVEVTHRDPEEEPPAAATSGKLSSRSVSTPSSPKAKAGAKASNVPQQPATVRVASTVLKTNEEGTLVPQTVWITTLPHDENAAVKFYKDAAANGSQDAKRRADLLSEIQNVRKRKEEDLAQRKAERLAARQS